MAVTVELDKHRALLESRRAARRRRAYLVEFGGPEEGRPSHKVTTCCDVTGSALSPLHDRDTPTLVLVLWNWKKSEEVET